MITRKKEREDINYTIFEMNWIFHLDYFEWSILGSSIPHYKHIENSVSVADARFSITDYNVKDQNFIKLSVIFAYISRIWKICIELIFFQVKPG